MKKIALATSMFLALSAQQAFAGASLTRLFCSSPDGKFIVSGFLPGQGEEDINLNVSSGTEMLNYSNENQQSSVRNATATVNLDARKHKVEIVMKEGKNSFVLRASGPSTAKLKVTDNGTSGQFTGLLTGTNPSTWEALKAPVVLRCNVTDEI